MPEGMTVRASHDIALILQHKVRLGTPCRLAAIDTGALLGCLSRNCLSQRLPATFMWVGWCACMAMWAHTRTYVDKCAFRLHH